MIKDFLNLHKTPLLTLFGSLGVWYVATSFFTILPDAADHWTWSRELFWGYYEQPPMVAAYIRFFDMVIPDSETAIKISSFSVWGLSFLLLYYAAFLYYGAVKKAFVFLILLLSAPYFFFVPFFINITSPMFLFFSAYMIFAVRFLRNVRRERALLYMGAFIGLGLLSKPLAVFYFVPVYGVVLLNPRYRYLLKSWQLYAAPVLTLIIFSPFIYYNYVNDWHSITYHYHRSAGKLAVYDWEALFQYIVGPIIMYGVVPSALIWFYFLKKDFWRNFFHSGDRMFWEIFFFIPVLFFGYNSFAGGQLDPQYLNTSFATGYFFLCGRLFDRFAPSGRRWILVFSAAINIALIVTVYAHTVWRIFPYPPVKDPTNYLINWSDTGKQASALIKKNNAGNMVPFIITRVYDIGGVFSLYLDEKPLPYSLEKQERIMWMSKEDLADADNRVAVFCVPDECEDIIAESSLLTAKRFVHLGDVRTKHPYTMDVIRMYKVFISEETLRQ